MNYYSTELMYPKPKGIKSGLWHGVHVRMQIGTMIQMNKQLQEMYLHWYWDTFQDGEPTTEGAFKDSIHHEAVLTSIPSPLPAQVDGTTDSPGSVQSSPADFNQSGPSHIDQASEVASLEPKQYDSKESNTDSNMVNIRGHSIIRQCGACDTSIEFKDSVQCCFLCNLCSVYHVWKWTDTAYIGIIWLTHNPLKFILRMVKPCS